jgi:hypothetical protein
MRALRVLRGALAAALVAGAAHAEPLSGDAIRDLCAGADGPAHCGRRIEAAQLERLPNLARRDGDTLRVSLYPSGVATFADGQDGGRTYSLWDFVNELNAVVLFTTAGDESGFVLLMRVTGRRYELPAEPKVAPDRQHVVTADFCAERCANELAVWRASRESLRKEVVWRPPERWSDATAQWKDASTIVVEYTRAGETAPRTIVRTLGAADWSRVSPP